MDDKYKMFSEEDYVTKMQLKCSYQNTVADMIYAEVKKDRMNYKYELTFSERHYYITMNATLIKKITRVYEVDCRSSQQDNLFLEVVYSLEEWLNQYQILNKEEIKTPIYQFLCGEEPLVIKVFVLLYLNVKEALLYHYLQYYYKEHWLAIIKKMEKTVVEYRESLDLTYELRTFLDIFFLHLTSKMLPLKSRNFYNGNIKEEIRQQYPQLSEKMIQFYQKHSKPQNQYTVEQYQKECQVSYESARQAMQKFVCLHLYFRFKVGKKYVYMPML